MSSRQATFKKATERHAADLGPKESHQHEGGVVVEQTDIAGMVRARRRDWIEIDHKAGKLGDPEYAAASQFQQHFHHAGYETKGETWPGVRERVDGSTPGEMSNYKIFAREQLDKLRKELPRWEWFCLWHCVGEGRNFFETARLARWTTNPFARLPMDDKTVKKYTFMALTSAARFYRVG